MTELTPIRTAALAIGFVFVALAFSYQKKSSNDFSHVVQLTNLDQQPGPATWTSNGDSIAINEVRGPSDRWITGDTYEVRGTHKLSSRDKAGLRT